MSAQNLKYQNQIGLGNNNISIDDQSSLGNRDLFRFLIL